MNDNGLKQFGDIVIVTGPALGPAYLSALSGIKRRQRDGLPTAAYEDLASAFFAAMSASGHTDVRLPAISDSVPVEQPTVPLAEAADRLSMSERQARRLAPQLGGKKIGGRWFVDETALAQHIEGKQ